MGDNVTGADAGQVTVIRGADLAGAGRGDLLLRDGLVGLADGEHGDVVELQRDLEDAADARGDSRRASC